MIFISLRGKPPFPLCMLKGGTLKFELDGVEHTLSPSGRLYCEDEEVEPEKVAWPEGSRFMRAESGGWQVVGPGFVLGWTVEEA